MVRSRRAVYSFAAYLAEGFGAPGVAVFGDVQPVDRELAWSSLESIPIEFYPSPIERNQQDAAASSGGSAADGWIRAAWWDNRLDEPIVVCWLPLEAASRAADLSGLLRGWLDRVPIVLLGIEEPSDARRTLLDDAVAPSSETAALAKRLAGNGLNVAFFGSTPDDGSDPDGSAGLIVLEHNARPSRVPAPASFQVTAIVPVFNEEDIVEQTLRYLIEQGIGVYLLDNWSTDQTIERARPFLGQGLLAIERFPASRAPDSYDLRAILGKVEELGTTLKADWCMLCDADERRRSPWSDLGLKDGIYYVDRCGFNCIDHLTLNFWPTHDDYDPRQDVEAQLTHFELSDHPGHFHQRRVWKNRGQRVSLAWTAGHDVSFEDRLVYPFRFLLKHYPIRSQAHGERKVLQERQPRFNAEERSFGWHAQYDALASDARPTFLRDPASLRRFDATFYPRYLIGRLSGIGIFDEPPSWATAGRE